MRQLCVESSQIESSQIESSQIESSQIELSHDCMHASVQPHQNLKEFLHKMLASPDVIDDPSFFKKDLSPAMLQSMFLDTCDKTCELERKKEKERKQEAVGAALEVQIFEETLDPQQCPTLLSKETCINNDKDITPVLWKV